MPGRLVQAVELERSFVYAGKLDLARDTVSRAIDRGTQSLSFLVRHPARAQLRIINKVATGVDVKVSHDAITVALEGAGVFITPADGRAIPVKLPGGERAQLSQVCHDDGVEQVFTSPRGEMRRYLHLDQGTLRMDVVISSRHLREPIAYGLRYVAQ